MNKNHTPSGQHAVEPVLSAAETADRLEAWAREMLASTPPKTGALHLLDAVHYLRTAAPTAPTAPSTAAGEREKALWLAEFYTDRATFGFIPTNGGSSAHAWNRAMKRRAQETADLLRALATTTHPQETGDV